MDEPLDCIIAGGGAAGLSAALVLGRARRTAVLVDAGGQSNLAAAGIGGLLGHDRRPPAELYATGRAELAEYPSVALRDGSVTTVSAVDGGFVATLDDGDALVSRRLLLATGMEYRHPDVPGLAERWGGAVFHCPFCHGWEVHGRPLAVLSAGPVGIHQALLLRAWSEEVTLLCGPDGVGDADRDRLRAAGVAVDSRAVLAVHGAGRSVESVELADGGELPCAGVLVACTLHQRAALAAQLGVELADPDAMRSDAIRVDAMGATSVPGVYAAGDVLPSPPAVTAAIAQGNWAGAMIVASLFVV